MEYYSCEYLQDFYIIFNGQLDDNKFMAFCCEGGLDYPGISIKEHTVTETLDSFLEYRNLIIETSKKFAEENPDSAAIPPINGCKDCVNFKKAEWKTKETVTRVNFSIYPSPCQCKCIYCNVHQRKFEMTEEIKEKYEKVFDIVDELIRRKSVVADTSYQVSCGEITIHPYKDRIYEYVKDKIGHFYTNCFKYDENIAEHLRKSSKSTMNLSIDAGFSDTWQKVKGVNNFEKVLDNLVQYSNAAQDSNQVTLKYIVMPGINTTEGDYMNLISIMNSLKITRLEVSRDVRYKYDSTVDKTDLLYSVAYLYVLCLLHGIQCFFCVFSEDEKSWILKISGLIINELEDRN